MLYWYYFFIPFITDILYLDLSTDNGPNIQVPGPSQEAYENQRNLVRLLRKHIGKLKQKLAKSQEDSEKLEDKVLRLQELNRSRILEISSLKRKVEYSERFFLQLNQSLANIKVDNDKRILNSILPSWVTNRQRDPLKSLSFYHQRNNRITVEEKMINAQKRLYTMEVVRKFFESDKNSSITQEKEISSPRKRKKWEKDIWTKQ